jgi:hypothetical protein
MAHRDILRRRAILVAFGVEADINGWARLGGLVVIDPKATLTLSHSEPALLPSRPQRATKTTSDLEHLDCDRGISGDPEPSCAQYVLTPGPMTTSCRSESRMTLVPNC